MARSKATDARRKRPQALQLGWLLEALPSPVPVNLRLEGLTAHTAIIAQSGSGKSFMLGRLLEEIAAKTQARVLILDPNSDFSRFSEVEAGNWTKRGLGKWFGSADTLDNFKRRWDTVKFAVLTERPAASLGLSDSRASVAPVSITWSSLTMQEKASFLGLSVRTHPEEYHVIEQIDGRVRRWFEENVGGLFDLTRWREAADDLLEHIELNNSDLERLKQWPRAAIHHWVSLLEPEVPRSVRTRILEVAALGIWDRGHPGGSLSSWMQQLIGAKDGRRLWAAPRNLVQRI